MTFRICFTFGILSIAYNGYFPTILIVLLAVFNDGAMIALSKDRVRFGVGLSAATTSKDMGL